ncbi:MAG TPA: hypothetical protein VLA19_24110 [Herpetosiphonaceae bacterium]|nr:hypothetical protein [Herpetosiphonaceae bacterium]
MNQVQGELRYFGLAEWWSVGFSPDGRRYIEAVYQPMGLPPGSRPLTQGDVLPLYVIVSM